MSPAPSMEQYPTTTIRCVCIPEFCRDGGFINESVGEEVASTAGGSVKHREETKRKRNETNEKKKTDSREPDSFEARPRRGNSDGKACFSRGEI